MKPRAALLFFVLLLAALPARTLDDGPGVMDEPAFVGSQSRQPDWAVRLNVPLVVTGILDPEFDYALTRHVAVGARLTLATPLLDLYTGGPPHFRFTVLSPALHVRPLGRRDLSGPRITLEGNIGYIAWSHALLVPRADESAALLGLSGLVSYDWALPGGFTLGAGVGVVLLWATDAGGFNGFPLPRGALNVGHQF